MRKIPWVILCCLVAWIVPEYAWRKWGPHYVETRTLVDRLRVMGL